jgi:hypothetical protein
MAAEGGVLALSYLAGESGGFCVAQLEVGSADMKEYTVLSLGAQWHTVRASQRHVGRCCPSMDGALHPGVFPWVRFSVASTDEWWRGGRRGTNGNQKRQHTITIVCTCLTMP